MTERESDERVTFWSFADQVEQLGELVETGLYLNRSEAIRDGLRRAVTASADSDFRAIRDPLTSGLVADVERQRVTVRLPGGLLEAVDDLAHTGDRAPVVRRSIALLANEHLAEARP